MPRDGSNIFSAPAGTTATSGTPIESAKYNAFVNDVVGDLNLPRPIVAGGTGASTAPAALTALGAQPADAELTAIAGLTSAADRLPYFTGSGAAALATFTAAGRALVDDADAAAQRTTLGLVIGTNVQAQNAGLGQIAGLVDPNADRILFWDDSAGAYAYLTPGTGLTITGTTITAGAGAWTTGPTDSIASGASVTYSGSIPSTATEITLSISNFSVTTGDDGLIRIIDGGTPKTTGYVGFGFFDYGSQIYTTNGFRIRLGNSARAASGHIFLTYDASMGLWRYRAEMFESTSLISTVTGYGYVGSIASLSGVQLALTGGALDGVGGTMQAFWR
jgi:hypothetical protein